MLVWGKLPPPTFALPSTWFPSSFVPQRRQPQEFPFNMSTLGLMSWMWSENLESQAFHSDPHDLFLFFQPPLLSPRCYVWPEQRTDWREAEGDGWKHRAYMQQCDEACSLHICFHFGVCFQLGAREYGAPKCEVGCFQVVIWRTPPFFIYIDLFPIFFSHRHFKYESISGLQLCSRPTGEPLWWKICILGR